MDFGTCPFGQARTKCETTLTPDCPVLCIFSNFMHLKLAHYRLVGSGLLCIKVSSAGYGGRLRDMAG